MELILALLTAVINLLLGLLAFIKNPKSDTHRLFAFLTLVLAYFAVTNYFSLHAETLENTLFWIRVVMFGGAFMGPVIFLLVSVFPKNKMNLPTWVTILTLVSALSVGFLSLTPLVFSSVKITNGIAQPQPGVGIVFFGLNFLGFLVAAFISLVLKYVKSQGVEKVQIRFLLAGTILTFSLIAITNFILVNFYKITSLVFLGPSFTMILVGSIAYGIIKHRFLDIRLIAARAVAYSILLLVSPIIYIAITFLIGSWILGLKVDLKNLVFFSFVTVLMAFSFEKVKRILQKATDKVFYKGYYDSSDLLARLGHIMSSDIQLDSLATKILKIISDQMRITKGAFILIENNTLYDVIQYGFDNKFVFKYQQSLNLLNISNLIIFDELEEGPLKQLLREMDVSIVKRLEANNKIVGFFILGQKASGDVFSDGDIKFINIFAPEVSVAIQNAQSYDQIKKFNVTLTQEVEKATKDLKVANLKLQELDKLKDDFVSIASHELRTPMTAIRSYVWMALHKADIPLSQKLQRYLYRTLISTERLINLVNDMLNISRIESGRVQITPQVFDIQSIVKEVVTEVDIKAKEKNLQLKIVEDPTLPKVFADPDKVHQVLLNLVGNALKFTPANGVITLSFFSDGKEVEVLVKDSGVGILKEDLAKLFTKFGRLESSYEHSSSTGGTGLGLYICKSLINMMKGRVWATSEGIGKGTTFIFTLPVASAKVLANAEKYHLKPQGEAKGLEPVSIT